jgi:type IV pilus assembly protein PilB
LCPDAGKSEKIEGSLKAMIDKQFSDLPQKYIDELDFKDVVYHIGSSDECPNGTRGRMAVMEVFEMDKDLENAILKGANELDIAKIVRQKGMITMKEDAIIKSMNKLVPFEEVNML